MKMKVNFKIILELLFRCLPEYFGVDSYAKS